MVWRSSAACSFACSPAQVDSPEPHGALFVRYALDCSSRTGKRRTPWKLSRRVVTLHIV